ncbi:hypothetical protein WAX74_15815 [Psychrobacillus sp. FJAT-51614]|uniref:Uncharacterized protein n=1 Tax=Psychrobacillus mangrovi TaxID=3117745 RepID=A0ABU8F7W4_9BACI
MLSEIVKIEGNRPVQHTSANGEVPIIIKDIIEESILAYYLIGGGMTIIVTDEQFEKLSKDILIQQQSYWTKTSGYRFSRPFGIRRNSNYIFRNYE